MVWLIGFIPTESTEMLIIFSQKHFLFVLSVDFTLWDRETIKRYSTRQNQASTTYEITTSDSIETKSSLLDVDTYSKTRWLCGLTEKMMITIIILSELKNETEKNSEYSRVVEFFVPLNNKVYKTFFSAYTLLFFISSADFMLWDEETIRNNSTRQNQTSSAYQITASDSIESKSSLLDVSASLKASFLSGQIEVGGSASYLNDNKKFKNQSRVTLQFKATTAYERLTMTHLEAKNRQLQEIIKKSNATHVVTGILYGANAFFVFDSEKLDSSSVQNIGASMHTAIKKIPSFDFEAKVDVKLSKEEKAVTDKFSCKFYGDFILDSNPSTFEDAVKTYSQLPKLLGGNGEKTVPVKVWLTPLKKLDPTAEEMKGEICVGLLRKAENALEIIKEMEMRCNDSLDEDVVQSFPQILKKLKRFQNLCEDSGKKLRQTMEKKVPAILEGKEDSSLEKLLDDQEKSPFSLENLDKWLDNTEREINVIRSCVEAMKGIKITKDESEFDRAVLAQDVDDVLSFVFTSVETDDPYLDQMEKYLHSHDSHNKSFTPPTKDHWFFSAEVVANLRQKAEEFCSIAKGLKSSSRFSFIVASETNKKYKGATIYHYRKGRRVTEEFSKPAVPCVASVKDRQELLWCKSIFTYLFSCSAKIYAMLLTRGRVENDKVIGWTFSTS